MNIFLISSQRSPGWDTIMAGLLKFNFSVSTGHDFPGTDVNVLKNIFSWHWVAQFIYPYGQASKEWVHARKSYSYTL